LTFSSCGCAVTDCELLEGIERMKTFRLLHMGTTGAGIAEKNIILDTEYTFDKNDILC
jgi:hypothetical protein